MGTARPQHPGGAQSLRLKAMWQDPKYRSIFMAAQKRGSETLRRIARAKRLKKEAQAKGRAWNMTACNCESVVDMSDSPVYCPVHNEGERHD